MIKKAIIIDDEPLARSIISEYLMSHSDIEIIDECNNGFEGLKSITQNQPDLVFLDIQMPKITGFEMLELLQEIPSVIFTTAFDQYAIKAFESNAIDYLLKPFNQERFDVAIEKWRIKGPTGKAVENLINNSQKQPEEFNRIVAKKGNEIRIIPTSDIVYIEAYSDYVKIFTKETYFLKKKTMNYYEQTLDNNQFFRSHRSYIFNLSLLTKLESMEKNSYVAILKNDKKIPISRSQYPKLKEILGI